MTNIIPAQPSQGALLSFAEVERLADYIAKSRLFGMQTREQALSLMMISQAEGRHPALAARDYDIIQGRPAKKAEAMMRDFLSSGGRVEWHKLTDNEADATFSHAQGGTVRISWTMERAVKAGLAGKENYKKFPRQMLRSRVTSEGVRTVWPMATSGMYVPEEATDFEAPAHHEQAHIGPTIEHAPGPAIYPPPEQPTAEAIGDDVPDHSRPPAPRKQKVTEWLGTLQRDLEAAGNVAELEAILSRDDVRKAQTALTNGAADRLNAMVKAALMRTAEPPPDDGGVVPAGWETADA